MKKVTRDSKEIRIVIKNLELENLHLKTDMKEQVIEVLNSKKDITPYLLKELLAYGKV